MNEPSSNIAYRILELEQKIEAYQKLHTEELSELRHLLLTVIEDMLAAGDSHQVSSARGARPEKPTD